MNNPQQIIAVDLDDVLFDFVGYFFKWHNQRYGSTLSHADVGVNRKIWEWWGGTRQQATERIPAFFSEIDMLSMPPFAGSIEALNSLKNSYSLNVVSARDAGTTEASNLWLDKYFPGIFDQVFLGISNPLDKEKNYSKAEICQQIGAEVLIDDQLAPIEECRKAGIQVLMFGENAWNQSDHLPPNVTRVKNWNAVAELLLKSHSE